MHTLTTFIKSIFVDADFDTICKSRNGTCKYASQQINRDDFSFNFRNNESAFGTNVIDSLRELSESLWMIHESLGKNVINIFFNTSVEFLKNGKSSIVCKQEKYLSWNDITRIAGEDIFVCAYLVETFADDIRSFAWKPFLESDSIILNDILKKGLYEIHSHFNGASLNFDVCWLALVNGMSMDTEIKKELKKKKDGAPRLLNANKAIAIRYFLHSYVNGKMHDFEKGYSQLGKILDANTDLETECFLSNYLDEINTAKEEAFQFLDGNVVDYAIPKMITEDDKEKYYNVPLIGERKLLYDILKRIRNQDSRSAKLSNLLYAYIVAKNQFRQTMIQCDSFKGFSHFQSYERLKTPFGKSVLYWKLIPYMAAQCIVNNQPIKVLESRIAPKKTKGDTIAYLRDTNRHINTPDFRIGKENLLDKNDVKLGFVLHFIKKEDKSEDKISLSMKCRNKKLRSDIRKQANAIYQMVQGNNAYVHGGYACASEPPTEFEKLIGKCSPIYPLVGIDAANSEFGCRPEVFAPVFRMLRTIPRSTALDYFCQRKNIQLGRTFHVGEDYYDIVDGLRAIDECIRFMNFGEGDRLGHAVALGVNAYRYYKIRRFKIILPKQDLLDDVAWMYAKMKEFSILDQDGLMSRLEDRFRVLYADIYGSTLSVTSPLKTISIGDYYDAWKLRGDEPGCQKKDKFWVKGCLNEDEELTVFRTEGSITQQLYHHYHFNGTAKIEGRKPVVFEYRDNDYKVIQQIQREMRKIVADKHIAIETNPTSNIQITDVELYSKHPIVTFNNKYLKDNRDEPNISVSINTDDQGVFATSLEKEFTLMAVALSKATDQDGNKLYKDDDIYLWLDHIRDSARVSRFVQ